MWVVWCERSTEGDTWFKQTNYWSFHTDIFNVRYCSLYITVHTRNDPAWDYPRRRRSSPTNIISMWWPNRMRVDTFKRLEYYVKIQHMSAFFIYTHICASVRVCVCVCACACACVCVCAWSYMRAYVSSYLEHFKWITNEAVVVQELNFTFFLVEQLRWYDGEVTHLLQLALL